ncbi:MAG: hypothetical protein K1X55_17325 [Chitinophagales bacterium]|nr:hypothetical protein [Chitinophagales bacterium]
MKRYICATLIILFAIGCNNKTKVSHHNLAEYAHPDVISLIDTFITYSTSKFDFKDQYIVRKENIISGNFRKDIYSIRWLVYKNEIDSMALYHIFQYKQTNIVFGDDSEALVKDNSPSVSAREVSSKLKEPDVSIYDPPVLYFEMTEANTAKVISNSEITKHNVIYQSDTVTK